MKSMTRWLSQILLTVWLASMNLISAQAAETNTKKNAPSMTRNISGEFDLKMVPQPQEGGPDAPGRMLLDKRFHGALDATSVGQMLALMTATKGSAGYVAMELVTGSLGGKRGSFTLQHSGTMTRGSPTLSVSVVPDSGTEALHGLGGQMKIRIEGGKHFYDFEYTLPDKTE